MLLWRLCNKRSLVTIRELIVLSFLVLSFGISGKAQSASARVNADVRCVVVAVHMMSSGKPAQRTAGMMAIMYYFGRLDVDLSQAETERLIESEAREMNEAALRSNAIRCGKALAQKGKEIRQIGIKLLGNQSQMRSSKLGIYWIRSFQESSYV